MVSGYISSAFSYACLSIAAGPWVLVGLLKANPSCQNRARKAAILISLGISTAWLSASPWDLSPVGPAPGAGFVALGLALCLILLSAAAYFRTRNLPIHPGAAAQQIPDYLQRNYWWAYVHPLGVRIFERQWLVNAILWGNFSRLRDAVLDELGPEIKGHTLQVACVYGDFSVRLAEHIAKDGQLDIVDILPIQLNNLRKKLGPGAPVHAALADSSQLSFANATFNQGVLFFLLHEQPQNVRRRTLAEAIRVLKPGGKLVVVDYHMPTSRHPLRYLLQPILRVLEPYALDLWHCDICEWLPTDFRPNELRKQLFFDNLYQKVVIVV
jgi:ubiquinone/menaquinone biosynthesis C-methylase UbiE